MKARVIGLLAIGASVAFPAAAFAQAPPPPPGSYGGGGGGGGGGGPVMPVRQGIVARGAKIALNAAGFHGADVEDIDDEQGRRIGFGFGVYLVYALNDQLSMQVEALYMQKGATFDSGDDKLKFDYIEVPVLGRYDLGQPGGGMRPFLVGGLSAALNIGHELDSNGETQDLECVAGTDILAHVGGGATLPQGANALSFELRLSVGLVSNIKEDPDSNCNGSGDVKNNVISAFAGYEF